MYSHSSRCIHLPHNEGTGGADHRLGVIVQAVLLLGIVLDRSHERTHAPRSRTAYRKPSPIILLCLCLCLCLCLTRGEVLRRQQQMKTAYGWRWHTLQRTPPDRRRDSYAPAHLLVAGCSHGWPTCRQTASLTGASPQVSWWTSFRAPGVVERLASRLSLLDRVTLYRASPEPDQDGPLAAFLTALCADKTCLRVSRNESYTEPTDYVRLHHYAQHQPSTLFAYGESRIWWLELPALRLDRICSI